MPGAPAPRPAFARPALPSVCLISPWTTLPSLWVICNAGGEVTSQFLRHEYIQREKKPTLPTATSILPEKVTKTHKLWSASRNSGCLTPYRKGARTSDLVSHRRLGRRVVSVVTVRAGAGVVSRVGVSSVWKRKPSSTQMSAIDSTSETMEWFKTYGFPNRRRCRRRRRQWPDRCGYRECARRACRGCASLHVVAEGRHQLETSRRKLDTGITCAP